MAKHHMHETEDGRLIKCYHDCKNLFLSFSFWLATLVAFPLEHAIWEYLPPFCWITKWVGLG